jgi:subtilisin family serine protease
MNKEAPRRVRVTVIDTGIDYSHPYIRKRWRSTRRRPSGNELPLFHDFAERDSKKCTKNPCDNDGHGTFIAGVLLQLVPEIELSIARIGTDRPSISKDDSLADKVENVSLSPCECWLQG